MEYAEIISMKKPKPEVLRGIYFLLRGSEIVYVGRSENILARVFAHIKSVKIFDSYNYFISTGDLEELELEYILKYKPIYNRNVLRNGRLKNIRELKDIYSTSNTKLNKFIEVRKLHSYNGRYEIAEFKDFPDWVL